MAKKYALASGHLIDIENLTSEDISLDDIAHHLSKICRFNGATPLDVNYSVGEHCINLSKYLLDKKYINLAKAALLHDASEAFLSDIVSPIKHCLPDYKKLELNVQSVIFKKYLMFDPYICCKELFKLDKQILIDEVKATMPNKVKLYKEETGLEGLGCYIQYNGHPKEVKYNYLQLCKYLSLED